MARRSTKKSSSVKVNFKNVESRKTPPEGDYPLEVLEATMEQSSAGNDQITFTLEISEGEYKGVKVWLYCPLAENSLWKLHAFLSAMGEEVPEEEMEIDLSELVGKSVMGILTHDTYQGKKRAKLTDFDSMDNYAGGDKKSKKDKKGKTEPEEAEGKKSKKGKKDEPEAKPGKKDKKEKKPKKVSESDVEDMDEDELETLVSTHKLKVDLDDYKKLPKKVAAVIKALKAADLLEDD